MHFSDSAQNIGVHFIASCKTVAQQVNIVPKEILKKVILTLSIT